MSVFSAEHVVDTTASATRRCTTRTWTAAPRDLLGLLPAATGALAFVAAGDGLVGWGQHAAITVTGPDAAGQIQHWYTEQCALLEVTDDVGVPGSGPMCFTSLGFGRADASVAVIPEVVVGKVGERRFVTHIGEPRPLPDPAEVRAPGTVRYADAEMSTTEFMAAVEAAITRIRAGEAAKVVLAHGLSAMTQFAVDERFLLTRLAERYPSCTTFAVDGLLGASPETLIRRRGRRITSRVLAGTAWREHHSDRDARWHAGAGSGGAARTGGAVLAKGETGAGSDAHRVAQDLLASAKDVAEHAFAVSSVADVLRPLTCELSVPDRPAALELANLTHLSTDIAGTLPTAATPSALDLAARLHPTAAVGGTPTDVATAMIAELEPTARGRYAAPVGWFDARGDGEFAIALRCATVEGQTVRMMAGCGIVADSDPATEAAEAQVKMVPVRDALEGPATASEPYPPH